MSSQLRIPFALKGGLARRNARRTDAALRHASTYGHPAGRVVRIETHLSVVYLAGRFAYKIVKPIRFGFVDLTRLAQRYRCALAECTLNRPLAEPLYLDVRALTAGRDHRRLHASTSTDRQRGQAPVLEYVVRMRRLDANAVLSQRVARDVDVLTDAADVAERLAQYHLHAPTRAPRRAFGSPACVLAQYAAVLDALQPPPHAGVTQHKRRNGAGSPPHAAARRLADLRRWCDAEFQRIAPALEQRRQDSFVRACHGDLHLANLVRWRGQVLMFDCIDFDPALRWIDIASDLAFPLMDFVARGRPDAAHRLLARWLECTGDCRALQVLRFFVVYRALVRALVARLRGDASDSERYARTAWEATHGAMGHKLKRPPVLLLCHGFSGSGKSRAGRALADRLPALHLSSDMERKRAAGQAPNARLPAAAYTAHAIDDVYQQLLAAAELALAHGYDTLVDATFLRERQRAPFIALAARLHARMTILDFSASRATLFARVAARAATRSDVSDADVSVLAAQLDYADPLTDAERAISFRFDTEVEPAAYASAGYWRPLLASIAEGVRPCRSTGR